MAQSKSSELFKYFCIATSDAIAYGATDASPNSPPCGLRFERVGTLGRLHGHLRRWHADASAFYRDPVQPRWHSLRHNGPDARMQRAPLRL